MRGHSNADIAVLCVDPLFAVAMLVHIAGSDAGACVDALFQLLQLANARSEACVCLAGPVVLSRLLALCRRPTCVPEVKGFVAWIINRESPCLPAVVTLGPGMGDPRNSHVGVDRFGSVPRDEECSQGAGGAEEPGWLPVRIKSTRSRGGASGATSDCCIVLTAQFVTFPAPLLASYRDST
eukprot:COSAG01_NODE_5503_length_4218_cov_26.861374_2_plen_181_part_00